MNAVISEGKNEKELRKWFKATGRPCYVGKLLLEKSLTSDAETIKDLLCLSRWKAKYPA